MPPDTPVEPLPIYQVAATFKIVLAAKADSDGLTDVRLRITVDRVVRYLNTGVAVKAKDWNPKGTADKENWIKSSNHDHDDHNETLFNWLRRGKKLAGTRPDWTADHLKAALANGDADPTLPDFLAFCQRRLAEEQAKLDEAHRRGKPSTGWSAGTLGTYRTIVAKLVDWRQGRSLPFAKLSTETIQDFERHLSQVRGNNPTTVNKGLRVVHSFIREAVRAKLLTLDKDPMALYDFPTPKPNRVWLNRDELDLLETAPLSPRLHLARAVYFLQHYLHGSRVGVILRLRWKDRAAGRIRCVDKGGRIEEVEESLALARLLDSLRPAQDTPDPNAFILPYLPADFDQLHPRDQVEVTKRETSAINANLKRVATRLGIEKTLSSHVARRTLATLSERTLGGDLRRVGGLLGHTNTRTTQMYLKDLDTHDVDDAARQVYHALGKTPVKQLPHTQGNSAPSQDEQDPEKLAS